MDIDPKIKSAISDAQDNADRVNRMNKFKNEVAHFMKDKAIEYKICPDDFGDILCRFVAADIVGKASSPEHALDLVGEFMTGACVGIGKLSGGKIDIGFEKRRFGGNERT